MYTDNDFRLYHHGILGQKWGKRQGPPYPLDNKSHSAAEKKAGWKKSLLRKGATVLKEKTGLNKKRDFSDPHTPRISDPRKKPDFSDPHTPRIPGSRKTQPKIRDVIYSTANKITGDKKKTDTAVKVAKVAAGVSALQTIANWKAANELVEGYAKIGYIDLVSKGSIAAGKTATLGALATIGAMKVYNAYKEGVESGDSTHKEEKTRNYKSSSAKRNNEKIDKGFKDQEENSNKKQRIAELEKKYNDTLKKADQLKEKTGSTKQTDKLYDEADSYIKLIEKELGRRL